MQVEFDAKTNTLTITGMSINPKASEPSESGRSIPMGYDRVKINVDGRDTTVAVNVYAAIGGGKKKR